MSEVKDPAIKLFGKTISLLRDDTLSCSKRSRSSITTTSHDNKKTSGDESSNMSGEESLGGVTSSRISDDDDDKNNGVKKEEFVSSDSVLKKPDKILPCPRCNSMDTKFCYYNNYNVNQPRHFCKNCQRYWTAGGSMRSVPVGSGRRKNKAASASGFRHIVVSDQPHNGTTVLAFGSDKSQRIIPAWNAPPLYGVLGPWNGRWISAPANPQRSIWSAFNSKDDERDRNHFVDNNSLVMQANPAALSRSLNFQERT